MSGLTLPAAVTRERHWNPTPHHAECNSSANVMLLVLVYNSIYIGQQ